MRRRGTLDQYAPLIERGAALDRERRTLIQAVEERKAARNATSQEVARLKRSGEPAEELIARGRGLGEEISRLERELAASEGPLQEILLGIPNVVLADVPEGGEEQGVVVRQWGEPRRSDG